MFLEIKICMTIVLLLYALAYWAGNKRFIKWHIVMASAGFILDLYVTYWTETMLAVSGIMSATHPWIIKSHIMISVFAIATFLLQMTLGILRKRNWHIISAKYIFFPAWVVSYFSGMYLIW